MNIKRAKEEIRDSIAAYLAKDEQGNYVIPRLRQRPILLLGAPGIGKTQIMEQAARECGINLLAYTITHHTRQSALGLPFVTEKEFDGKSYSVTEYTMSEIVASIYEKMEKTGIREGILFIDEINCVSETLAPAMLQFLQYKTFGSHEIPEGWIIVAAGNPPEYNKSVREFDVVTLDRVRKIEVEPDYACWKEYALERQLHPAVISYLDVRPSNFYRMETTVDGQIFATPRGWEDLSEILKVYEKLDLRVDSSLIVQYIQHEEIAKDFAGYLELYRKYQLDYQLDAIFDGRLGETLVKKAASAPFDEKLAVVSLLLSRLRAQFTAYDAEKARLKQLYEQLARLKAAWFDQDETEEAASLYMAPEKIIGDFHAEYLRRKNADLLTREEDYRCREVEDWLQSLLLELKKQKPEDPRAAFALVKESFDAEQDQADAIFTGAGEALEYAFDFMEAAYGNGQEMVVFITDLNLDPAGVHFLQEYSCERYSRYSRDLLIDERSRALNARLDEFIL